MSTNTNKYGIMFMSQGAATYKSISIQTKYFLELMKQMEELAQDQAKAFAADGKTGIIASFLDAAKDAAYEAGQVYHYEALSSIIQASVAGAGMLGIAGSCWMTRTGAIDEQINDANGLKQSVNSHVVLRDDEEAPAAPPEENARFSQEKIQKKLNQWANEGGKSFNKVKTSDVNPDTGAKYTENEAQEENDLRAEAHKHIETRAQKESIQRKLDDHIQDLKSEKQRLDAAFNNWTNTTNMAQQGLTSAGQAPFKFKEADATEESQTQQAVSSVLKDAGQKVSQLIDTSAQSAAQYAQSADASASSLGQIRQAQSSAG